jgi:hypothetical protein
VKRALAAAIALAVVVAAAVFWPRPGRSAKTASGGATVSYATVTRRSLTAQDSVDGTLGYAGGYPVFNQSGGMFTALPATGTVVTQGKALYRVDGRPVVLMYGRTPAYRTLAEGMRGTDVAQLNHGLHDLGYSSVTSDPRYFGFATAIGLEHLQDDLGLTETGTLPLGQAVFLPTAVRVGSVTASRGGPARPGVQIMQTTSTARKITVSLDASEATLVKTGQPSQITWPDNRTTKGTVTYVGKAVSGQKIKAEITPARAADAGRLETAAVQATIVTGSADNVMVVPVTALLATAGGGYQVELDSGRTIPVTTGLFDDADGLVEVTGLSEGQRIVGGAG